LRFLLAWLLFVGAIPCRVSSGNPAWEAIATASRNDEQQLALEWLSSIGISGLCHPSSDQFAPEFPKCSFAPKDLQQQQQGRYLEQDLVYYDFEDYTSNDADDNGNDQGKSALTKWDYIINISCVLVCVLGAALASGLTVGLLSIDPMVLTIKIRGGANAEERQQAELLLPLVKKHHLVMVTLLLANAIAGESLPIFLHGMVPEAAAVVISVVLVLIFGEIVPAALFTGPNQLKIASRCAPLVGIFITILYPITYPIAKLLDRIMHGDNGGHDDDDGEGAGKAATFYTRGELAALIRIQYEERIREKLRRKRQLQRSLARALPNIDSRGLQVATDLKTLNVASTQNQEQESNCDITRPPSNDESIDSDEVMMIEGALQMKTKRAVDVFLSFRLVFCIPFDMPLNDTNIFKIYTSGYSRVPVYVDGDRRKVKGILMTRQLIVINQNQNRTSQDDPSKASNGSAEPKANQRQYKTISDLALHIPQCVAPHTKLVQLVNMFQTGGSIGRVGHMAFVCARPDVANRALEQHLAVPEEAGLMG